MTISAACVICVDHPCGHALALVWWRGARAKAAGSIAPRGKGAVAVQGRDSGGCGGGVGCCQIRSVEPVKKFINRSAVGSQFFSTERA